MRIDCHAHVHPAGYRAALGDTPLPPTTLDGLRAVMAQYAIDAAVVSVGPPAAFIGPHVDSVGLARLANDGIAQIVSDEPDRFAGLATLPLPDLDAALEELDRCYDELGLDGVMLLSNTAGVYLGDPTLEPLLAALDERGAYVFLHPGFPPHALPLAHHPVWLYEFPFDTVRAVTNLIYSGTLERHGHIRWQIAHLGGAAPFLSHRLASLAEREPQLAGDAPAGVLAYLSRLYYDTGLANNVPALAATREVTGIDHIVFGTDWPYAALPADGGDPAPALDTLGPSLRSAVDAANARPLVPRLLEAATR